MDLLDFYNLTPIETTTDISELVNPTINYLPEIGLIGAPNRLSYPNFQNQTRLAMKTVLQLSNYHNNHWAVRSLWFDELPFGFIRFRLDYDPFGYRYITDHAVFNYCLQHLFTLLVPEVDCSLTGQVSGTISMEPPSPRLTYDPLYPEEAIDYSFTNYRAI